MLIAAMKVVNVVFGICRGFMGLALRLLSFEVCIVRKEWQI